MTTNNTIINSIMEKYIKCLCAVIMVLDISANAWGTAPGANYTLVTSASSLSVGDAVILYDDVNDVGVTGTTGTSATISSSSDDWIEYTVAKPTGSTLTLADWSLLSAPKIYADEDGNLYKFTYSTSSSTSFTINSSGHLVYSTTRLAHYSDYVRFYGSAGTPLKVYKVGYPKVYGEECDGNLCVSPEAIIMGGEYNGDEDALLESDKFTITTKYSGKQHYVYVENDDDELVFDVYDYEYDEQFGSNGYYTAGVGEEDISQLKIVCYASAAGTYSATLHVYAYNYDGMGNHKHVTVPIKITVLEEEQECTARTLSFANGTSDKTIYKADGTTYTNAATPSTGSGYGTVTYSVTSTSPSGCATVNGSGVVSFSNYGTATITASLGANGVYCAAPDLSYNISMMCKSRTLTFASSTPSVSVTTDTYTQTATKSAGSGTISYAMVQNVGSGFTIDSETGEVSFNGNAGTATITASITADATGGYCTAEGSYTLTVTPVVPGVSAFSYTSGETSMTLNGSAVTNNGGTAITAYGYIYSTTANAVGTLILGGEGVTTAQVAASNIAVGTAFAEKTITSLSTGTTYYVRAYATNSSGTGYSEIQSVRTVTYSNFQFSCAELTLTEHLATAGTPIFMTSTAGKKVRSQDYITITGSGLTPSAALTFPDLNSKFDIKKADGSAISTEADGTIDVNAYIYYTPDLGDTYDGLDKMTSLKVSVGGAKPKSAILTHDIIGRHVPANFVIAVKNGASWYALPANMTSTTPAPELITVDNNSSPTMAYTSDDNIFTLYGQHNSSMTAGGEYIKLAMHGQSNAPMAAADGTGSKIGKSSATNIDNNIGNDYWWLLTQKNTSVSTTTDVKYNVTIGNSNSKFLRMWPAASGGAKWGMYAYGINEIRLIPATAVTEMDLDVFEWGTEAIVIKYNGSGTLDGANVAGTNASSAELVDMPGDLKKITNLAGLSSNPSGLLAIRINDGGVKQALLPIPFIITGTKTDAEVLAMVSDDAQAAAGTDVVILNGGYLKQSSERTFNNIHIYGGGKDSVGNNLTTQNIYLHGGFSWLTNSFALPQMKVKDGVNIVSPEAGDTIRGIYYDLTLNNSMYYVTALPKTVAVADITNEEGTQKFSAWMKRYSGKGRTLSPKESGWIRHGETAGDSIKRGIGYEIAIKPRKSRSYGVLRFPLLKDTIWSDETNCAPPIVGWGYSNDAVTANNKGWNLLGNPFFSAYNNTTEDATRIEQRGLVQHKEGGAWTGTYDFNESTVRYFTIPNYTDEDYRDVRANPYKLDAFYPFFVQAKVGTEAEPGSLSFGASGRALKAPSILRKHILDREIIVDFMLRDENDHTDAAGLTINNEYTDEFDMDDKEKTIENGTQFMKVYTIMDGHRIAFNALPEETAQGLIPVGYIAPTSGTYTFTLPQGDYPELAHLWLIDNELNTQTDLLLEEYDFQTGAGQNDTRFTINLALSDHKTPTDIENVDGGNNGHKVNLPEKFIYQDNLYIRHNGILYDGTGKRIR